MAKQISIKARRAAKSGKSVSFRLLPEEKDQIVLYVDTNRKIPIRITSILRVRIPTEPGMLYQLSGDEPLYDVQHDSLVPMSKRYQTMTISELITYHAEYM